MSNREAPAGNASGPSSTSAQDSAATFELPAKLRVHALAKLLGASSREVITALDELGEEVRSAQSNITREVALRVVQRLRPEQLEQPEAEPEQAEPAAEQAGSEQQAASSGPEQPTGRSAESGSEQPETRTAEPATPAAEFSPAPQPAPAGTGGLSPVFAAPQAMFLAPEPVEQRPAPQPAEQDTAEAEEQQPAAAEGAESAEGEEEPGGRRRRRRGRRGRGRGKGGDGEQAESGEQQPAETAEQRKDTGKEQQDSEPDKQAETESGGEGESAGEGESSSRRRRRRRRRKGSGDDDSGPSREDDPPNTVVHVREERQERQQDSSDDEVRAVKGSTRLEAKRQRRRDGREAGRRRAPVLSESEFLARRESVDRRMVVRQNGEQTQIAVLEDNVLVENFVTSSGSGSLVGNVYLGRVQNVLPSMEAAFVDIGRGRNAVLYAGEVDWDAAGLAGKARRIEQALSTGDSVLVQVTKDPVGHKGARLTTQISLPGRFLVYVPGGGATGISRKLPDNERKRLKEILKRIVPDNAGVIIRTASEGTSEEALDRDVRRLQAQWEVIKEKSEAPKAQAPQLLYEEPDLLIKVVRDLFTEDFSSLTVQGTQAWDTIEAYVQHVAPDLVGRLHKHVGKNDVFTEQRITEQIAKALDRKVWLPSGGYLVIDRTEAMTVIDVNTGKFTGSGGNLEETVTRNNLEAAEEIVRQLRLRDIGGIIVIDFIDMVLESNRDLVLRRLTECLGRDRTRHQVAEVTSLGLVQMTRKRVGTGLLEAYSSTCEHCRGRGLLVSTDPVHQHGKDHSGGGNGGSRKNRKGKQDSHEAEHAEKGHAEKGSGKDAEKAEKKGEKGSDKGSSDKQQDKGHAEKGHGDKAHRNGAVQEPVKTAPAEPRQDAQPAAKAEPEVPAESGKPAEQGKPAAEAKPAESGKPTGEQRKPAAESPKPAAEPEEPAAQPEPPAAAQPAAAAQSSANGKPAAEPAPAQPAADSARSSEAPAQSRSRRRKVSRPAGSAGTPAQPVVMSLPEKLAEPASNGAVQVPEPATTTVTRRVRRGRAASRPAGPPPGSPEAVPGETAPADN